MPPLHLLIKPSSGMCNMRCRYCFYHDITEKREQSSYGFMSEGTLETVIRKAMDFAEGSCDIAFQGGEPTLIGLPFFQKVIELEKQYNHKHLRVSNALQTNGFNLNADWARFFADNSFLVGISVDGTIHTHDGYRKDASGDGTFLNVMKTIDLFNQYHVEYNILTVVNKKTAAAIDKIYKYYKKMGFGYLQFIPCLDPFDEPSGSMEYSLTPKMYGEFLNRLFDLWYEDFTHGSPVSIRHFDNYLSILLTGHAESCDMNGFCSIQNVIEADGEVYPCDFWVLDEYKLGNLNNTDFEAIYQKRDHLEFLKRSMEVPDKCRSCPYYPICRGGCYRHRTMTESPEKLNYFCEAYEIFFAHNLERLQLIARRISSPKNSGR